MGKEVEETKVEIVPTEETTETLDDAEISMDEIDPASILEEPAFEKEEELESALVDKPMNFTTNVLAIEKYEAENAWKEELMRQNNIEAEASRQEHRHPYGK